ncbi:MAG: hypothetical protein ACFFFH_20680 [Candidatus Thorarchaeota archaeon]
MSESIFEKMGKSPLVVSVLIFDSIASFLTLIIPARIMFFGDVFIALGMAMGSVYILHIQKMAEELYLKNLIKSLLLLTIFGGIASGLSISLIYYLLGAVAGIFIPLLDLLIFYIRISVSISFGVGFFVVITFFSFIKLKKIFGREIVDQG